MPRPLHRCQTARRGMLGGTLVLVLACQDGRTPTGPDLARGGNAVPFTVSPTALDFLLPATTPRTLTARVQYVGTITAATSDAQCATVSPSSVPASKPAGSSVYVATFAVTPVGAGTCTITLTDKRGQQARVTVSVEAALAQRMVFASGDLNTTDVFARAPDGTITRLTDGYRGSYPAVAPGGRIVFGAWVNPDHNDEIYSMAADGADPTRLTIDAPHGPRDAGPTVSPDGQLIAFSRDVQTTGGPATDIHVMGIAGDNPTPTPLTESDGFYRQPRYSADGSKIVFSGHRESNTDVYLMDADGSDRLRLTTDASIDGDPVFAPDGRVVFSSDRNGSFDLYRMNADGSGVERLTSDPGNEFGPAFTGDGRLVFVSDRDGDSDIYLAGANGVWYPLTANDERDYAPAF